MSSGWQQKIIDSFGKEYTFYAPSHHMLEDVQEYSAWDLHYVKECNILFGYMERSNPSGYGLALEIGYAKALSKTIILVDERSGKDEFFANHYRFIRNSCDVIYNNLDDGIALLRSISGGVF